MKFEKLRNGGALGSPQILPEMLKAVSGSHELKLKLLNLIYSIWEDRKVPQEWIDVILIPILKRGNLSICDNWREISVRCC